ncbi:mycothiol transferase [Rathayibacter soli]|uniref:mycothiol transferase n=1 Tax=Rathayibacter soli TaxID=3144168 RepID=UPI0027E3BA24|nr:DUF664 domain-containing protein [Glaciibacter superstes]
MASPELLIDAFDRIQKIVRSVLRNASADTLAYQPDARANTIGWLVWHLTRVQDDHLAAAFDRPQTWIEDGWADRFKLPFDDSATGYGHTHDEVAAVKVDASLLGSYHDAVHDRSVELIRGLSDAELERIVDTSWDPPVTLAVRLISVIADDLQHAGQASYVRGLATRAGL